MQTVLNFEGPEAPPVYRIALVREREGTYGRVASAEDIATAFRRLWPDLDREQFVVFFLDQKHRIIGANLVSIGDIGGCLCNPRDVFKAAILANSPRIIVAHNHPSGETVPSEQDKLVTQRLVDAGKIMGIGVLDHVIVGDSYYSFCDDGKL